MTMPAPANGRQNTIAPPRLPRPGVITEPVRTGVADVVRRTYMKSAGALVPKHAFYVRAHPRLTNETMGESQLDQQLYLTQYFSQNLRGEGALTYSDRRAGYDLSGPGLSALLRDSVRRDITDIYVANDCIIYPGEYKAITAVFSASGVTLHVGQMDTPVTRRLDAS